MGASNWVYVDVEEIRAVTDKALLCRIGGEEFWIPLSQVADADDYSFAVGDADFTLSITEWIAREKGLEE